jgi:hypothetical protein
MRRIQLHALPSTTLNSFHRQIDIVFTKDGICTIVDIIIANPTRTNLLPRSCATQGFESSNAIQTKEKNYHDQHPTNQIFPLTSIWMSTQRS